MSKVNKRRECPAIGREITSAECGEKRGSAYPCPATCSFFPFAPANYSEFLHMEAQVDKKGALWMFEESRRLGDPVSIQEQADRIRDAVELDAFMIWNVFLKPDASGLTCIQRWENAGFTGVKNDERVLLRAKTQIRVALLEVHRILDHETVEGVDLLDANRKPLRVLDRSLASAAPRFGLYLSWFYPLPHFWRISGVAIELPDFSEFEPEEAAQELIRHLGGPESDPARRLWLAEHFSRIQRAIHSTEMAQRAEMFAQMDAQFGKAVYELKAPFDECAQRLDALPDVENDAPKDDEQKEGFREGRVWFSEKSASHAEEVGGRGVLGRVLMGQTHWRIQAMGRERLEEMRRRFEDRMGARVQFNSERRDNLAAPLAAKDRNIDRSLVPPRLLAGGQKIILETSRVPAPAPGKTKTDFMRELAEAKARAFLGNPIPALDGMTPREAAKDPTQRPRLIRLMKTRIRDLDQRNLKDGRQDSLDWMLQELGLGELMFDPPPPRARPDRDSEDDEEDHFLPRPEAPRLEGEPFDTKEASTRLAAGTAHFETSKQAISELAASGSFLLEDAGELTRDLMDEGEFTLAVAFMIQVWFALVPPGVEAPYIDPDDLADAFNAMMASVAKCGNEPSNVFLKTVIQGGRQPALVQQAAGKLMETSRKLKGADRPGSAAVITTIVLIRVVTDCLDQALRE
ncbi:MAG: hypothetical protein K9N62_10720 [Verrucomicrobia bacterium]|nr:hypothetical protein [Verrucomicrobiota bacterium]